MYPSYIAQNPLELIQQATPVVQEILATTEIDDVTKAIAEKHSIPVGMYLGIANVITFVLVGAIQPENVVLALKDLVKLEPALAQIVAEELEKGIFQKVRSLVIGKEPVAELTFKKGDRDEELRKQLLDTTKRESGLTKPQSTGDTSKKPAAAPGSRNQLLEQLQMLGTIPNDEEVEARLKHIQEQLTNINTNEPKEEGVIPQTVLVKAYDFGENADKPIEARKQVATYSAAPTKYNVDPYREISEE